MYFAAAKTMSLVMFIHYAVGSAVANRFAALKARGDHERPEAPVARMPCNWTFWPSLAGRHRHPGRWASRCCGCSTRSSPPPTPVMFVLAVGFLVRASMGPAEFVLNMLGEQGLVRAGAGGVGGARRGAELSRWCRRSACWERRPQPRSRARHRGADELLSSPARRLELEISIWTSLRAKVGAIGDVSALSAEAASRPRRWVRLAMLLAAG